MRGPVSALEKKLKPLPKMPKLREMIEFLARMPTDAKIFLTMAVLSLAAVLIALRWLI